MSDELKPCHHCGGKAIACREGNTRPIEDALRAEIEQLQTMDRTQCPNCNNCIRNLRGEVSRLKAENTRLFKRNAFLAGGYAELKAENAKLKARVEAAEYFIAVLTTYGDFSVPNELISEPRSAWEALK